MNPTTPAPFRSGPDAPGLAHPAVDGLIPGVRPGATTSTSRLYRLGGACLFAGCVVLVIGAGIRVSTGTDPSNTVAAAGWFVQAIGAMLVVLGLPAAYLRQAAVTGRLGLVGFVGISLFLFIFGIFGGLVHGLVVPVLAARGPAMAARPASVGLAFFAAALLGLVGSLSWGLTTVRARVFPRWTGILPIVGGLALFFGHPLGMHVEDIGLVALMAGLGWCGLSLRPDTAPSVTAQTTTDIPGR